MRLRSNGIKTQFRRKKNREKGKCIKKSRFTCFLPCAKNADYSVPSSSYYKCKQHKWTTRRWLEQWLLSSSLPPPSNCPTYANFKHYLSASWRMVGSVLHSRGFFSSRGLRTCLFTRGIFFKAMLLQLKCQSKKRNSSFPSGFFKRKDFSRNFLPSGGIGSLA